MLWVKFLDDREQAYLSIRKLYKWIYKMFTILNLTYGRGGGLLAFLVNAFAQRFEEIVSVKTRSRANLVASWHLESEKASLPMTCLFQAHELKKPTLKLYRVTLLEYFVLSATWTDTVVPVFCFLLMLS